MNIKWILTTLLCIFIMGGAAYAMGDTKTDTFKVYGNCSMCKERIEGSLKKKDGVISKNWNKQTKILTVTYDPTKVTLQQIADKIAASGHDSELATASDKVYNNLHDCCKYDRPQKK